MGTKRSQPGGAPAAPIKAKAKPKARVFQVGEAVQILGGEFQGRPGQVLSVEDQDVTVLVDGMDVTTVFPGEIAPTGVAGQEAPAEPADAVPEETAPDTAMEVEQEEEAVPEEQVAVEEEEVAAVEEEEATMVVEDTDQLPSAEEELQTKREELRSLVMRPDHAAAFMNVGRLVYVNNGETDWGWGVLLSATRDAEDYSLKVFTADPAEPDSAEGLVLELPLCILTKISTVRTKLPEGDPETPGARAALLHALVKVKTHSKFAVSGIPELDPVVQMKISADVVAPIRERIAALEGMLAAAA